jgi:hypothetical protein
VEDGAGATAGAGAGQWVSEGLARGEGGATLKSCWCTCQVWFARDRATCDEHGIGVNAECGATMNECVAERPNVPRGCRVR